MQFVKPYMAETCDKAIASKYHRKCIILSYNIRNIEISNQNNLKLISSSFKLYRASERKYSRYVRRPRQNTARERTDELQFSDDADYIASSSNRRSSNSGGGDRRDSRSSASEQVPIRLAFPGNDYKTSRRSERDSFSGKDF